MHWYAPASGKRGRHHTFTDAAIPFCLSVDASTPEIRAIEVTDNRVGDAPMLPGLRAQIPPHEPIASVSTGGTYGTKDCQAATAQRGAQAVIPPRKNGKPWKETRQKEQQCAMQRCGLAKGWGAGFGSDGAVPGLARGQGSLF